MGNIKMPSGATVKRYWLIAAFLLLPIIWMSRIAIDSHTSNEKMGLGTSNYTKSHHTLILYAYSESAHARGNLEFYIRHALHDAADFIFIFNGETDAMNMLPYATNIKFISRPNECYDLGGYAAVLLADDLYKKYNRFIMMNASVRGPFIPYWSDGCWSDMYLNKITDSVKLVGMTMNCLPLHHLQSMMLATDSIGMSTLLFPSNETVQNFKNTLPPYPYTYGTPVTQPEHPGINVCPNEYWAAVSVEVHLTLLIKAAGYKVDAMMAAFHKSANYEEECQKDGPNSPDVLYENTYFGTNLHPFDTIFAKENRGTNQLVMQTLTEWTYGRNYSSYDFCRAKM